MIALAIRPIATLVVMAIVVIPIELLLRRIWPEGRIKQVLFGRNFDKRHPVAWVAILIVAYAVMIGAVWAYIETRS
jgi:hypothetical protein